MKIKLILTMAILFGAILWRGWADRTDGLSLPGKRQAVSISGTVTNTESKPIADVEVAWMWDIRSFQMFSRKIRPRIIARAGKTETDATGNYAIMIAGAGTFDLAFQKDNYANPVRMGQRGRKDGLD